MCFEINSTKPVFNSNPHQSSNCLIPVNLNEFLQNCKLDLQSEIIPHSLSCFFYLSLKQILQHLQHLISNKHQHIQKVKINPEQVENQSLGDRRDENKFIEYKKDKTKETG